MARQGRRQKRSKKDSRKNQRYITEDRKRYNKVRRITKHIKKLERMKAKNPDSKVDRSIQDLIEMRNRWEKML